MNTQRIAKGWALIAEGAMELSLAYEGIEPPVPARAGVSESGAVQAVPPQLPPAPTDLAEQHVATVLGQCPDHFKAWTVKAGGIAKDGKPYDSFWRCAEKTDGNYCRKRPVKAWVDSHPIGAAA